MIEHIWVGGPWDGASSKDPGHQELISELEPGAICYCTVSPEYSSKGIYAKYIEAKVDNGIVRHYFIGYERGPWIKDI